MSHSDNKKELEETTQTRGGRNPLIIFLGFLVLGAGVAFLFLGGEIFGNAPQSEDETINLSVLDQISEFPTSEPGVGKIQTGGILNVGDQAHNFMLNDLDGNPVSLEDFRGQPVIVNFWATWCAPCRIEMPELQEAFETHQDEGLVILALDQGEPADVARAYFYDEMNLTFTPLLDENSAVASSYGSYSVLPSTYFINEKGQVSAIHRGPMILSQIDGYLAEMNDNNQS